ncbi:amidophosphoribosyltransferase, partial [Candidatus Aerophobetes bacterium]|nr:amidophosphoribosyltransferase [Candidatus Aerophobetes bacterium]
NHPQAAKLTYLGLYALQHRGQESAGIATSDGLNTSIHRGLGLVDSIFSEEVLANLPGRFAIGHNRYSTTGSTAPSNIQPLLISFFGEGIAISHNGNLINATEIREKLELSGSIFQSTMDTEVIVHLFTKFNKSLGKKRALVEALRKVKGAYSLVMLFNDVLIGARDHLGFRPLVLGSSGSSYLLASETCAFDLVGATYIREIKPGEMVIIDQQGIKSYTIKEPKKLSQCIFEHIYFARPDSIVFGETAHTVRGKMGKTLAREHPAKADLVIPVPDSGISAALGYAQQSRIAYSMGLTRNHYVGRTFIQPLQFVRDMEVKIKLNPIRDVLKDKKIVLVDDSIVRGTTSKKIIGILREAGAKEIHFRISSPPIKFPCFFGIDTPVRRELIASTHSVEKIRKMVGANSLAYLSLEGLLSCVEKPENYCTACFSGKYPLKVKPRTKYIFEKREKPVFPIRKEDKHQLRQRLI